MSLALESANAPRSPALTACVKVVSELTSYDRDEMFALMSEHYLNVTRGAFESDLAEKQWVILVRSERGAIRGFSTQKMLSAELDGRPVHALFSGDTIVHRDEWGQQALARQWGRFALDLVKQFEGEELHWFLISKGYKTYRFLPVFFKEFFPRFDAPTPASMASRLNAFAVAKFGEAFAPARGVIAATEQSCRLRPGIAELTTERLRDEHVRYFHERNPRASEGEELACIAPLTRENFSDAAYRVINKVGVPPLGGRE